MFVYAIELGISNMYFAALFSIRLLSTGIKIIFKFTNY